MKSKDEEIAEKEEKLRSILFRGYFDRPDDPAKLVRLVNLSSRQLREYLHQIWTEWAVNQQPQQNGQARKPEVKQ